jgi:hypothetical protein
MEAAIHKLLKRKPADIIRVGKKGGKGRTVSLQKLQEMAEYLNIDKNQSKSSLLSSIRIEMAKRDQLKEKGHEPKPTNSAKKANKVESGMTTNQGKSKVTNICSDATPAQTNPLDGMYFCSNCNGYHKKSDAKDDIERAIMEGIVAPMLFASALAEMFNAEDSEDESEQGEGEALPSLLES